MLNSRVFLDIDSFNLTHKIAIANRYSTTSRLKVRIRVSGEVMKHVIDNIRFEYPNTSSAYYNLDNWR